MSDDLDDIVQDFLIEARELLENLDRDLLILEEDTENTELLNQIFRHAHTIKGNASFFGFMQLSEFTHQLENIFDRLRSGQMKVTHPIMDLILEGVDVMKKLVANVHNDGNMDTSATSTKLTAALKGEIKEDEPKVPPKAEVKEEPQVQDDLSDIIQDFLAEAGELLENLDRDLLLLEEQPDNTELLNQIFRHAHTIKGNAAFFGFMQLSEFTHQLENILDRLRSGQMHVTAEIMDLILEGVDVMKKLVANVHNDGSMDTSAISAKLTSALQEPKQAEPPKSIKQETAAPEPEDEIDPELLQYVGAFITEAKEFLQKLSESLIELEQNHSRETLDEIFRVAHTLKGMSASLKLNRIATLTHKMENLLDQLRKGEKEVDSKVVDLLFKCLDALETLVDNITSEEKKAVDAQGITNELKQMIEGGSTPAPATKTTASSEKYTQIENNLIADAIKSGKKAFELDIQIDPACAMKAVRTMLVARNIGEVADIIKTIPSNEDLMAEKFDLNFTMSIITDHSEADIKTNILDTPEIAGVKIIALKGASAPAPVTPQPQPKAAVVEKPKPAVAAPPPKQPEKAASPPPIATPAPKPADTAAKPAAAPAKKTEAVEAEQTIRIEVERLDNLMDWVGELVIAKNRLLRLASRIEEQYTNNPLSDDLIMTSSQISYAITELHQAVLKTRMLPIKKVFSKFPRMIRDLSRDTKKEVDLVIRGEETELDKSVIEKISDPLVHIIRNSVDHGIEKPETREANGKPRKGTVQLSAAHEGNYIIIEIEDDGKGMDPQMLIKKALEKNVLTEDEASRMTDKEALGLIFAPGFSTAEVVSNISGRGVGMNVVKSNIEQLGGIVDIDTKPGNGSIFRIKLPLTLAIIPALLVKVGSENLAIPLAYVLETNRISAEEIYTIDQKDVIYLRENVISLVTLGDLFGIKTDKDSKEKFYSIILGMGQQKIGLLVDELLGQEDIVVKPLGEIFANISMVAGATIMGDGNVVLILDVNSVLQYCMNPKKNRILKEPALK